MFSSCRDNLRTSLGALRQLRRIAVALGESRTREELIPFITEPQEDNDDHLHLLAQVLGDLLEQVGGTQYASTLLMPLEALTGSDENSVRDAAVDSIRHIMTHMSKPYILQQILPLLSRLAKGSYPQRVAACELCAHVHQYISSQEGASARIEFEGLTKDPLPVVRRAAAANVANLAEKAGPDHTDGLVRIFVQMAQDGEHCCDISWVQQYIRVVLVTWSGWEMSMRLVQAMNPFGGLWWSMRQSSQLAASAVQMLQKSFYSTLLLSCMIEAGVCATVLQRTHMSCPGRMVLM